MVLLDISCLPFFPANQNTVLMGSHSADKNHRVKCICISNLTTTGQWRVRQKPQSKPSRRKKKKKKDTPEDRKLAQLWQVVMGDWLKSHRLVYIYSALRFPPCKYVINILRTSHITKREKHPSSKIYSQLREVVMGDWLKSHRLVYVYSVLQFPPCRYLENFPYN